MKLLHTADWHVGRQLRGRSRAEEQRAVLAEIAALAGREAVDVVLVAGDVFESAAPSAEAEAIAFRTLLDCAATGAAVVVVAGNHDHPARWDALAPLLSQAGIHALGRLARPRAGGVVSLETRSGPLDLGLLPFPSQRDIVRAADLMADDASEHVQTYDTRCRAVVSRLVRALRPDAVRVVVAHLMVEGGVGGGGERAVTLGRDYTVSAQAFPASLHYAALGHVHRTQAVPGPCPIWYAGSPLQLDFGDDKQPRKQVLLVDVSPTAPARVTPVDLESGRRLATVRGSLAELGAFTGEDAYLRVVVEEPRRAGLADEVFALLPQAVEVQLAAPEERGANVARRLDDSPDKLFETYLSEHGVDDSPLLDLFRELAHEALGATDPA